MVHEGFYLQFRLLERQTNRSFFFLENIIALEYFCPDIISQPERKQRCRAIFSREMDRAKSRSKLINFNKKKGRTSGRNVKIFLWKFREKVGTQQSSGSPFNFRFDRENTRYIALYKIGGDWGKQRSDQRVD